MNNPFEEIDNRLNNIESLLFDIKSLLEEQQTNSEQKDKFLTIEQAADFLHLAKQTIYGKVCNREIPFMKQGGRLYFSKQDLVDYIKDGRKKTMEGIIGNPEKPKHY